MEKVSVYKQAYHIMAGDVDFTKRLKPSSAFNYFQEIAGLHADNLGIGFNTIEKNFSVAWVLIKMKVEFIRYPVWEEDVTIETWPQIPKKYEFYRDYIVKDNSGNVIIKAISTWVILDVNTRAIIKSDRIATEYPPINEKRALDYNLGKIRPTGEKILVYKKLIGCSDIDMNGHINNSKYIDYIIDCFNLEMLSKYRAKSIHINYQNEACPGDMITLYKYVNNYESTGIVYVEGINEKENKDIFKSKIEIGRQ